MAKTIKKNYKEDFELIDKVLESRYKLSLKHRISSIIIMAGYLLTLLILILILFFIIASISESIYNMNLMRYECIQECVELNKLANQTICVC